ncbi:MAG: DUF4062 domain-containing protein [Prevotella sp.]|nr:DUF4062 domain-containing protein [Prevotella sp.]
MAERNGIKIFVSSTVYDFETQLTDVFAMLDSMGYEVYMSKKGTIPLDSTLNTFVNCVEAVEMCDVFLCFIRPLLGSGIYKGEEKSVTELEIDAAIACGMPRFVMADYRVEYAHKFLSMMHLEPESIPDVIVKHKVEEGVKKEYRIPNNLIHPHAVRMYRTAVRRSVRPESERTGNWVQPFHVVREYCELNDIRTFIEAQFHNVERVRGLIAKCKGL